MSIAPHLTQTEQVIAEFGQNPYLCYQCQRCASGCPTAQAMRYWPSKMVRLVQLGLNGILGRPQSKLPRNQRQWS